jgi:C4-type Zn-finger protein
MRELSCPRCKGYAVQRTRRSLLERWFSLFFIYPYRCQRCRHRFRMWQPGVRYVRKPY